MNPCALSSVEAIKVVTEREIRQRIRAKPVRWGTVALVLVAVGVALLPRLLPGQTDPEWTVATAGATPPGFAGSVEAVSEVEGVSITLEATQLDPETAVRQGGVDAALVDGRELVVEGSAPDRLVLLLSTAVGQAELAAGVAGLGGTPEDVAELLTLEPLEVRSLQGDDAMAREGVAFVGTILLLVAILTYGGWVMNSVLEEKSNRIVEIIVSAIRPSELLAGKVLGAGLVGLAQLALVVTAGVVASAAAGTLPEMPAFLPAAIAGAIGWFVLGFAFYAVGYAAAGSLASRQEDAASAATPMTGVVMVGYFAALLVVNPNPGGTAAQVMSFIPPFTPLVMPVRMANDAVRTWEVAVAVAVMLVATWLVTRLAAKVYTNALLHSGGRLKARAALRAARS